MEIDIQTPIPAIVQQRRKDRNFLFLGCRFAYQLGLRDGVEQGAQTVAKEGMVVGN